MIYNTAYVRKSDLPDIVKIQNRSSAHKWTQDEWYTICHSRNVLAIKVLVEEVIAGYTVYELSKDRIEILQLVVDKQFQRMGIAKAILKKLGGKLTTERRTRLIYLARETDLSALTFLKHFSFWATEILKGFYNTPTEDAIIMELSIPIYPVNRIKKFMVDKAKSCGIMKKKEN